MHMLLIGGLVALGSRLVGAHPPPHPQPHPSPKECLDVYDYIVVGGGPAGIIAAERLAEAKKHVLLLERGPGPTVDYGATPLSWNDTLTAPDVPGLYNSYGNMDLFTSYICDDTAGTAACVLGGGCTVNQMVFIHPQQADFNDKWPAGWLWKDVQPAADRLYARNPGTELPSADGQRYDYDLYGILAGFFESIGWKSVDQIKQPDEKHQVYSYPVWNVKDQKRAGPLRTYLPLAQELDNFTLRLESKVIRILRAGPKVIGVELETASGSEIVRLAPGGKVILAAGALSTPRLLFNSGIGPRAEIAKAQQAGIAVPPERDWISLPVGVGVMDHPIFYIDVQTNGSFLNVNATAEFIGTDTSNIDAYEQRSSGVLTQGRDRLTFWTSQVGTDGVTRFFQGSAGGADSTGVIEIIAYITHGLTSAGTLVLNDAGNATEFETSPYLQTQGDRDAAIWFLQQMFDFFQNPAADFSILEYTNVTALMDSYTPGIHYVHTAKMGLDDGRLPGGTSVVDTNTKVYGTDNLYIVDGSIHPDLPTGNTQAIVMIVAEAAVAKILEAEC
ncbi:hypothetical protein A1O1_07908 [Capronia coronata CBS 617.96]|uniref:Glucose-methanol-choline oxidoreductase N-terminal domain-containing protein n=1 Tax=Capronia coronata CBS 617.96 TaxID=1182541 RepID=W9XNS2_9EURO|nr:uncharacterized protein A1O1_07908 [Capronia coronata CBS 617.96]EXJ81843.1 hypothetical protein A1O1_07908 [Capronia coronata CBS 617.96]